MSFNGAFNQKIPETRIKIDETQYDIYKITGGIHIKQIHSTIKNCVSINHKNAMKCMTINTSKK